LPWATARKEIASLLGISFKTVVTHRYNLASKAGTANIALLTRLAIRQGIVEP
jgi:DNA-binding CsgD family transcriptional regulator